MTSSAPTLSTDASTDPADPRRAESFVSLRDVHVVIEGKSGPLSILNGVSLDIAPGQSFGLVGESGSGKSMTANAMLGLLPASARIAGGSIEIGGVRVDTADPETLRRMRGATVGTILQDPTASLNPSLRVGAQVGEPLRIHRKHSRRQALAEAAKLIERVGIIDADRRTRDYPHQFSGGMRQRLVGAAAIACDPELIIADEPTTALDVTVQAAYLELLAELQRETGSALLLVSHDLGVISRVCDHVAVMYAGRIVEVAPTDTLFRGARHPYTLGLLSCLPSKTRVGEVLTPIPGRPPNPAEMPKGCPFAPRCPAVQDRCLSAPPPLTAAALDHSVACFRADELLAAEQLWPVHRVGGAGVREATGSATPVIELRDVGRTFTTGRSLFGRATRVVEAVKDVTLRIERGETVSIVGESGSGKTTCAKLALGLDVPTRGSILIDGVDLASMRGAALKDYRRKVQAVFQDPYTSFNPRMTMAAAVAEPLIELTKGLGRSAIAARVDDVLALVGLDPARVRDVYPHQLSGGQRQRVAIARALATEPECLILDEPVSALDVSIRVQVLNVLREVQERTNVAILAISHDLGSVKYMSDRVIVMYRGDIVEQGATEEIFARPRHDYTRQLLADAMLDG